MVYISPNHVRDRSSELWSTLRNVNLTELIAAADSDDDGPLNSTLRQSTRRLSSSVCTGSTRCPVALTEPRHSARRRETLKQFSDPKGCRRLSVRGGDSTEFNVSFRSLHFTVPDLQPDGSVPGGVESGFLEDVGEELAEEQEAHQWKVTLGQKRIGGDEQAINGACVLTSGKLVNGLLLKLVDEFVESKSVRIMFILIVLKASPSTASCAFLL